MGYIDEQTVAQLMALVPETEVVAAVAAADIGEDETRALEANMMLLTGSRDKQLWPDAEMWVQLEGQILREQAAAAVQTLASAEGAAGGAVMRDSITMMLELIHVSGDPMVLARNPESWLWGPVGPPISGSFDDLRPERRYAEHAQRCGHRWDMSVSDAFDRHDVAVCEAAVEAALAAVEAAPPAEMAAYNALNSTTDAINAGFETASTLPRQQWPVQDMARYSQIGWEAVEVISSSVNAVLDAAAGVAVIGVMQDNDTYEDRGVLVPASRARVEVLRRWFAVQAPKRPAGDELDSGSLSFWDAETDPLGLWAAALTAARMQVGRSHADGEPSGAADTLLNR